MSYAATAAACHRAGRVRAAESTLRDACAAAAAAAAQTAGLRRRLRKGNKKSSTPLEVVFEDDALVAVNKPAGAIQPHRHSIARNPGIQHHHLHIALIRLVLGELTSRSYFQTPPFSTQQGRGSYHTLVGISWTSLIPGRVAAGMLVHPAVGASGGDKRTLVDSLVAHCGDKKLSSINGPVARGIVHRLDRGTSGLIVAAKSDLAHALLGAWEGVGSNPSLGWQCQLPPVSLPSTSCPITVLAKDRTRNLLVWRCCDATGAVSGQGKAWLRLGSSRG